MNGFGQLGRPAGADGGPAVVAGLSNVVEIAAAGNLSMARDSGGHVWTWGWDYRGQLGRSCTGFDCNYNATPGMLAVAGAKAIAAGEFHAMLVTATNEVRSWGLNTDGQLGNEDAIQQTLPVSVQSLTSISQIAAGQSHSLALSTTGTQTAWGDNHYGQVGDGTTTTRRLPVGVITPSDADLLAHYAPELRYDAGEPYLTDSAEEITNYYDDSGSNTLQRDDGTVIAAAKPGLSELPLSVFFLAPSYAVNVEGTLASGSDWIDEEGHDTATYAIDAQRMHDNPYYADQDYGHAVTDPDGRLWLQYWFFSYYDDPGYGNINVHEGDWEMIQIRLDSSYQPDELTYAEHAYGVRCTPSQVGWSSSGGPIVYVARGTHASYPQPGAYTTNFPGFVDDAFGDVTPAVIPGVNLITSSTPSWVQWPGHWGNSKGGGQLSATSPTGPAVSSAHASFSHPQAFDDVSDPCTSRLIG